MSWLALIQSLVAGIAAFCKYLGDKKLMDAAEANVLAASLQRALSDVKIAQAARAAADRWADDHPDELPDMGQDPFRRD